MGMSSALMRYYYYSGGGGEITFPDPANTERGVTVFTASSPSYATALARTTQFEINTGSGDQARSWSFWTKADNFNKFNEKIFSVSNTTREQYTPFWINLNHLTLPLKFRFDISGNSTFTIYLEIESTTILLRNRWYHFTITYNPTGDASGLNLYINGVLDATATKTENGAYVSAYQDANMRLRLGGSQYTSSPLPYGGSLCDVAFWNRVLTADEVLEAYNVGIPLAPDAVTFVSALIDYFPLSANVTSDAGVVLTNSNVTFANSKVGSAMQSLSFKKHAIGNTAYVAFGNLLNFSGNNWGGYWRSGMAHTTEGDVLKVVQDMSNWITAPTVSTVINEPATAHASGISCQKIVDKLFLFYATYNDSGAAFVDLGRRQSADGLVGTTFGSRITMATTYPRFEFYGKAINISGSTWLVPQFEHNNGTEYRVSVWKTTDDGASFTKITVFEDTTLKLAETALVNVGNNVIAISRAEGVGNGLYKTISTDAGATWGTPVKINLGTGVCNAALCLDVNNKIIMVYMDRSQTFLKMSQGNVFADILAGEDLQTGEDIFKAYTTDTTYNLLGYPDIVRIEENKFLISVSSEFSSTRADLFLGYGTLDNL